MGIGGTLLVGLDLIRSKPVKITYRCVKGICLGKPAIKTCAKEILNCFIEIDTKKVAGQACKRAFLCLAPFGSLAGIGILAEMLDSPSAGRIAKIGGNAAGLIFTGPAYGLDSALAPLEVLIFGEQIPLIDGQRIFLFGSPFSE